MRALQPMEQADILVSELLGSFGDNELSPECLDGAQRFLAAGGISIPASYTSFLQPITAHKIWSDARVGACLMQHHTSHAGVVNHGLTVCLVAPDATAVDTLQAPAVHCCCTSFHRL